MKEIKLTQGMFAMIDDEDFERVNRFKWHAVKNYNTYYASRNIRTIDGKSIKHYLHWYLTGMKMIDHRDRDGLNCQKSNMRKCTDRQNSMNRGPKKNCSSKYKGVNFCKEKGKWRSKIQINGKPIHVGYFETENEAAKAYDLKAIELFGEFAYLNFHYLQLKDV